MHFQPASAKLPPAMADLGAENGDSFALSNLFKVRTTTAEKMKAMSDLSVLNAAINGKNIGDNAEARKSLATLLNKRGTCLALIGEHTKALSDLDEAVISDNNYAPAFNNRAWMRAQAGELQPALADVNKALELAPKMAEAYDTRGTINFALKHFDQAMKDFDQSIEHKNDYAEAYYHRALLHKKLGHDTLYRADEKKAIELKYPVE